MLLIYSQIDEEEYNISIGYKYEDYIITPLNNCKASKKIYIKTDSGDIEAYIYRNIYEINIAILKINSDKLITINSIAISSELICSNGVVKSFDIKNNNNINYKTSITLIIDHCISSLVPAIPLYSIESIQSVLSGSYIINNNSLIGIVIKQTPEDIIALPIMIINYFINNDKIKGIIIHSCYCEIMDRTIEVGHYIIEQSCKYKMNNKKKFTFKKKDIILSINNKSFNKDMTIYSDELKLNVPINTYFMFSLFKNKYISIKLLRNNKIQYINIKGLPLNNMYKIKLYNNSYLEWNGFIFCELTEEILNRTSQNNEKYYLLSQNNEKYIVLIDWIENSILTSDNLYIVSKMGNKNIKSLDDIKTSVCQSITLENNDKKLIIRNNI